MSQAPRPLTAARDAAGGYRSFQELKQAYGTLSALRAQLARPVRSPRRGGGGPAESAGVVPGKGALADEVTTFLSRAISTGALLGSCTERSDAQDMIDYWCMVLYRQGTRVGEARLADYDPGATPALTEADRPYPGLRPFMASECARYFGRQASLEEVLHRIRVGERVVTMSGLPGCGRTSFLSAAVLPALRRGAVLDSRDWHYVPVVTPGSRPLLALAAALRPASAAVADDADADAAAPAANRWARREAGNLARDPGRVLKLLADAADGRPLVLPVDGLEEALSADPAGDASARRNSLAFIDALTAIVESNSYHRLLLTLREEPAQVVGCEVETPSSLAPVRSASPGSATAAELLRFLHPRAQVTLAPPGPASLLEAIEAPARAVGLILDRGIADDLVRQLVNEPMPFPLLQYMTGRLWDARSGSRVSVEAYWAIRRPRPALQAATEQFEGGLRGAERRAASSVMLALSGRSSGGGHRVVRRRRSELWLGDGPSLGARARREHLLQRLAAMGLVTVAPGPRRGDDQLQLIHPLLATEWERLARTSTTLSPDESSGLEAIVLGAARPALAVHGAAFDPPPDGWGALEEFRPGIERALAAVGRIMLAGHPSLDWAGTGFLVAPDLVLTAASTARVFVARTGGKWAFAPGMRASIDFSDGLGEAVRHATVTAIRRVDRKSNWALLVVKAASSRSLPVPLALSRAAGRLTPERRVLAIGFPVLDSRAWNAEVMSRVFANGLRGKRVMPGRLLRYLPALKVIEHDCLVPGGAPGCCLLDLETQQLLGMQTGEWERGTQRATAAATIVIPTTPAAPARPAP